MLGHNTHQMMSNQAIFIRAGQRCKSSEKANSRSFQSDNAARPISSRLGGRNRPSEEILCSGPEAIDVAKPWVSLWGEVGHQAVCQILPYAFPPTWTSRRYGRWVENAWMSAGPRSPGAVTRVPWTPRPRAKSMKSRSGGRRSIWR